MDFIIPSPLLWLLTYFDNCQEDLEVKDLEVKDIEEVYSQGQEPDDLEIEDLDQLLSLSNLDAKKKTIDTVCNVASNFIYFLTSDVEEQRLLKELLTAIPKLSVEELKETLTFQDDDELKKLKLENRYLKELIEINNI